MLCRLLTSGRIVTVVRNAWSVGSTPLGCKVGGGYLVICVLLCFLSFFFCHFSFFSLIEVLH